MCYSATASFVTAGVLLPVGLIATLRALKFNHRYVLVALTPFFFGVQQTIEGFIWQAVSASSEMQATGLAYLYLFFAFFFWPCFMPAAAYFTETNIQRARWMYRLITLGVILGLAMYAPISMGFIPVTVSVKGHSLLYATYNSATIAYIYGFFYIMVSALPFMLSTRPLLKWIGVFILASMIISWLVYYYAFTSIWCYFVALISFLIIFAIKPSKA